MNHRFLLLLLWQTKLIFAFFSPLCTFQDVQTSKAHVFSIDNTTVMVVKPDRYNVVAFRDICPHRGASFHHAKAQNDTITCNYHAYQFSLIDGMLQSGMGTTENCVRLQNVPVLRRKNLIWGAVDGNMNDLPPPLEPEQSNKTFKTLYGSTTIRCNAKTIIENILDVQHICK